MSKKIGRNDPCPCGSGQKYKRCCLAVDEAAARQRARQQAFGGGPFDVAPGVQDEDDDDDFFDVEDEGSLIDVADIDRVCYTRGMVQTLSDLRSGRGVRVTEWSAPHIPPAVLESIEREAVDVLEGEWGDPKVGDPIQVDIIDLESESDVVTIQVFNRAIGLIHADSEELRRIHRVCGALESAAHQAPAADGPRAEEEPGTIERTAPPVASAATDISAVLKAHRQQGGTCALCGKALTRQGARKHLAACVPAHDQTAGGAQRLVHIRATAPGLPAYWLDLEVRADAKLDALDSFLRRIWLECCGHLSAFTIGAVQYLSRGYDFSLTRSFGGFGARRISERSMSARIVEAVPIGVRFDYEYDFGSTTTLRLTVVSERTGRAGLRSPARLLARNTAPVWPCAVCGQPATAVCPYCLGDPGGAFACTAHEGDHDCGEGESFLPVVNSPRMGVCGYCGVET